MVEVTLIVLALVAGVTGAWSPCGFSMVETLAPVRLRGADAGHDRRLRDVRGRRARGRRDHLRRARLPRRRARRRRARGGRGDRVAAAALEARGARIMPQVRRQVPESWRRVMPVPLAAGLYGVLLGLGFTTFILTFAVWALAGVSVALGDPCSGSPVGLAFGVGRTLPVVVARAVRRRGRARRDGRAAAHPAFAAARRRRRAGRGGRRAVRRARPGAGVSAAARLRRPELDGADARVPPARWPGRAAWAGRRPALAGNHPAIGGGRQAWIANGQVVVAGLGGIAAPTADSVAVSGTYVAWRQGRSSRRRPHRPRPAPARDRRRRSPRAERQPARL